MLYRQRYFTPSIRLTGWNYATPGWYFITICVKQRYKNPFGFIKNGYMCLSDIGETAHQYWLNIPEHFPHMQLDAFVIMPDHMHGIVYMKPSGRDAINRVSTRGFHQTGGVTKQNNPMLHPTSLPHIIRWYKGVTTFYIRKKQPDQYFHWQPRYYDEIIRTPRQLDYTRQYIYNNPKKMFYSTHSACARVYSSSWDTSNHLLEKG
ncbi:MAG: transposase [Patescibacteria group bacterium]